MMFLAPVLFLSSIIRTEDRPSMSTASYLYESCQSLNRLDGPSARNFDTANAAYCFGFINGYLKGINSWGEFLCVSDATMGTLARVYTSYMDKDPKLFDGPQDYGFFQAMLHSYVCFSKKPVQPQK